MRIFTGRVVAEMVKKPSNITMYCPYCTHERYTKVEESSTLQSDEHGELGRYTWFFCRACDKIIREVFRKFVFSVERGYPRKPGHKDGEFGVYSTRQAAERRLRNVPGLNIVIEKRLEPLNVLEL